MQDPAESWNPRIKWTQRGDREWRAAGRGLNRSRFLTEARIKVYGFQNGDFGSFGYEVTILAYPDPEAYVNQGQRPEARTLDNKQFPTLRRAKRWAEMWL